MTKTGTKFKDFMKSIEEEAQAEGPEAVAELEAFKNYFRNESEKLEEDFPYERRVNGKVDPPCGDALGAMPLPKTWTLNLSKYHRDNLLWLIGLIGWWENKLGPGVEPFTFANTGDWVGEIGLMLGAEEGHGQPNFTAEQMLARINNWKKQDFMKMIAWLTAYVSGDYPKDFPHPLWVEAHLTEPEIHSLISVLEQRPWENKKIK